MDTKKLYDLLCDEGFDFSDEDASGRDYAWQVTVELMRDPEWIAEYWIDLLYETDGPTLKKEIFDHMAAATGEYDYLRGLDRRLNPLWTASSLLLHTQSMGSRLLNLVMEGAEAYVEKHIEEWVEDAVNYHYDMLASQGDYERELRKDRMLEERDA